MFGVVPECSRCLIHIPRTERFVRGGLGFVAWTNRRLQVGRDVAAKLGVVLRGALATTIGTLDSRRRFPEQVVASHRVTIRLGCGFGEDVGAGVALLLLVVPFSILFGLVRSLDPFVDGSRDFLS